ncbi:probable nucleoporin Nup54 [Diaphorina citri]|uniref:Probable nucleoporin Nup54 n=1 Tax=Diaphorina citri TaxID=121845 RepID=A0A1S3CUN2_DIACI|nr:probable nucleoporin Nup54 [Diaphorina citri]
MAFNKPTFGATSTGFGGFGQTSTAFGSGGTTFGATQTPSLFGGQAQVSPFGAQPQTSTFGTQPQASTFGAPAQPSLFGAQQQTGTTAFGTSGGSLFGGTPASGGTTTFGTPQNNAFGTSGGSLFGAKTTGTAFGTTNTTGGFRGFGTGTSTAGGFSGFGTTTTSQPSLFSGFGQQTQTSTGLTNFNFGSTKPALGATPGFGSTGTTPFGGLGQPAPAQPQQQSPSDILYSSIYQVNIYGDERDLILAKFNMLMAFAGIGKGYFNQNQSVDYSPNTDLYKFTSVVYNSKPSSTNKDSLIYINLSKKLDQVLAEESTLVSSLSQVLGSKPNMTIIIDSIFLVDTDKTRVLFYVNEKQGSGANKRVSNTEVVNYLLQPAPKQQLAALGVYDVNVYQTLDEDTVNQYLEQPPPGINAILWKNAVRDNPDPEKFIPVPIVGFEGIKQRIKLQEEESKMQTAFLNKLASRISDLNNEYEKSVATIATYKQNILSLNNRLLKVIVKQEITRDIGLALNPTEELIRSDFENISAMINNSSYNFKSKISEMLSKIKLQSNSFSMSQQEKYVMDSGVLEEIRTIFRMEQNAIQTLLSTYNQYNHAVTLIKKDLNEILSQQE